MATHPADPGLNRSPDSDGRAPGARRYRLTPLLGASIGVHAAGLAGLAAVPRLWPAVLAGLVIDHAAMVAAGLSPRSRLLGPNLVRLPDDAAAAGQVALTFDDGPDPETTPRVLDVLDAHGARASFFCIGRRAERYAAVAREIVARGHQLENHTFSHRHTFFFGTPARLRDEIVRAQDVLASLSGRAPRFFRAPAGFRSPLLERELARLGLHLASWTRRPFDTRCGDPDLVRARLLRGLAAGDVLLLHDAGAARGPDGTPGALVALPRVLDEIEARGLKVVPLGRAAGVPDRV